MRRRDKKQYDTKILQINLEPYIKYASGHDGDVGGLWLVRGYES